MEWSKLCYERLWQFFTIFLEAIQEKHPIQNSVTADNKEPIISRNKDQQLSRINQTTQHEHVLHDKQLNPDKQEQKNKLAATLKQLDQYEHIRKQGTSRSEGSSQQHEDEIEKEKIRKVTVLYECNNSNNEKLCRLEKANGTFQFPSLLDSLSILSRNLKQMRLPE